MQKCHVSLGQLSDHPRLSRTLPHKAYESLAMKLPYLTAENAGVLELVNPGESCFVCRPADAESLAGKILWMRDNHEATEKVAEQGYKLYVNELKSDILVKELMKNILT